MEIFKNGAKFVKIDCHLHTKSDKEFKYSDEENEFIKKYVNKLKEKNIKVGMITNHNKFNFSEFKALRSKAAKEEIFLIPGVELSVKEGKNGLHVLIAFSDEWINNGTDKINTFLDTVFRNVTENRENENTRSDYDLFRVIEELNRFNKDYFIIFAHVDQKSGLFNECDGGMITSLFKKEFLRDRTYGLQKSYNNDNYNKFVLWTDMNLPRIEGSDPKSIDDIGKGKKETYIKIGEYSFKTVKYALYDWENRILNNSDKEKHGYIKSIKFVGGKLNGIELNFSEELNNIIGIRGSGKSAILEIMRDTLGIECSVIDEDYKKNIVKHYMGAGGKTELTIVDKYDREYKIVKHFSENVINIINENGDIVDITIDLILNNPLYFGQKDLSLRIDGYEEKLLEKLAGKNPNINFQELEDLRNFIISDLRILNELEKIPEKIKEKETSKNTVEEQLKIYTKQGVSAKLEKEENFLKDSSFLKLTNEKLTKIIEDCNKLNIETDFSEIKNYESKYNKEIFENLIKLINEIEKKINEFNEVKTQIEKIQMKMKEILDKYENDKKDFEEEFEEIKRTLNLEKNLDADTYLNLQKQKNSIEQEITELSKKLNDRDPIRKRIRKNIQARRDWIIKNNEFYAKFADNINTNQNNISIIFSPNENRKKFAEQLKNIVSGSKIRTVDLEKVSEKFTDNIGVLEDIFLNDSKILLTILNSMNIEKIKGYYMKKLETACEYIPNNKVEIKYHDKELKNYSLGQRASAIILFILAQKDNDLIIIDQPEDDMDNQVIYEELIKTLKQTKSHIQFIFSTHNPNIPVLGDAENIISIKNEKETIINNASIDDKDIQKDIVEIMEGGEEAFNRRKAIYQNWRLKNK